MIKEMEPHKTERKSAIYGEDTGGTGLSAKSCNWVCICGAAGKHRVTESIQATHIWHDAEHTWGAGRRTGDAYHEIMAES
jgi:hypothetical protein